jgi:predicted dienelactone hydrolase
MQAYLSRMGEFEQGNAAGGHAGEVEAIPTCMEAMTRPNPSSLEAVHEASGQPHDYVAVPNAGHFDFLAPCSDVRDREPINRSALPNTKGAIVPRLSRESEHERSRNNGLATTAGHC